MGKHIDKLKEEFDPDVVELGAIERVKSYVRRVNGKEVRVKAHGRKGDGPSHRADYRAMVDLDSFRETPKKQDAETPFRDLVSEAHKAKNAQVAEVIKKLQALDSDKFSQETFLAYTDLLEQLERRRQDYEAKKKHAPDTITD